MSETDPSARFNPYEQRQYMQVPSMQPTQANGYLSPQIEKLAELERGQIKLTASQTLAEVSCFIQSYKCIFARNLTVFKPN